MLQFKWKSDRCQHEQLQHHTPTTVRISNKVITTMADRAARRPHILWSICFHSFWGFGESGTIVHCITSQPANVAILTKMCSVDIFDNLQPVEWNLKVGLIDRYGTIVYCITCQCILKCIDRHFRQPPIGWLKFESGTYRRTIWVRAGGRGGRGLAHSITHRWVLSSSPLTHVVYLLPFLSYLADSKSISTSPPIRPGDDEKYRSRIHRFVGRQKCGQFLLSTNASVVICRVVLCDIVCLVVASPHPCCSSHRSSVRAQKQTVHLFRLRPRTGSLFKWISANLLLRLFSSVIGRFVWIADHTQPIAFFFIHNV